MKKTTILKKVACQVFLISVLRVIGVGITETDCFGFNHQVLVDMTPNLRRHVVGPGGEELISLGQEYPVVMMSVTPRQRHKVP